MSFRVKGLCKEMLAVFWGVTFTSLSLTNSVGSCFFKHCEWFFFVLVGSSFWFKFYSLACTLKHSAVPFVPGFGWGIHRVICFSCSARWHCAALGHCWLCAVRLHPIAAFILDVGIWNWCWFFYVKFLFPIFFHFEIPTSQSSAASVSFT